MNIRFSQFCVSVGYACTLWALAAGLQILTVWLIAYGIYSGQSGAFGMAFAIGVLAVGATFPFGGFCCLPGLFWRFRKDIETRVVQVEGKYAMQIRLFGHWWWLDAEYADWIHVVLFPDFCVGDFFVSKSKIDVYEKQLQHYLQISHKKLDHIESVRRTNYVRGEKQ